jgi:hypothetical protein
MSYPGGMDTIQLVEEAPSSPVHSTDGKGLQIANVARLEHCSTSFAAYLVSVPNRRVSGLGSLTEGREGGHGVMSLWDGVRRVTQLQTSQRRRDPTCCYNSL